MKLTNSGKDFAPAPMGLHKGVCVDIVDLGMLPGFGGKLQHKINFVFELGDAFMEDGRPFLIFRRFTATLAETGHLAPFLSKWRGGVNIKQDEEVDLDTFLNKPALLVIAHNEKDGKKYANIDAILPCAESVRPSGHYKRKEPIQKQSGSAATPRPATPMPIQQPVTTAGRTAFPSPQETTRPFDEVAISAKDFARQTGEVFMSELKSSGVLATLKQNLPSPGPMPTTEELTKHDQAFRDGALGITGPVATSEQKAKFLTALAPLKERAAKYFNSLGALGNDQPLEELPPQYCPATKIQFDNIMCSIHSWMDAQPKADDDVPF